MFGVRKDRLGQQLKEEIANIIQRELKDPGLGFVTITKVELSNDLSHAKVGYSCLGDSKAKERSQEALDRAVGFVRSLIKKRLRLRIIPSIVFRYDQTIERSIEMSKMLDDLKKPQA